MLKPPPVSETKQDDEPPKANDPTEFDDQQQPSRGGGLLRNASSVLISAVSHLALFILLAGFVMPGMMRDQVTEVLVDMSDTSESDEILDSFALEEELAEAESFNVFGSDGSLGAGASGGASGLQVSLDKQVAEKAAEGPPVEVEGLLSEAPTFNQLLVEAPEGMLGEPRAVVDNIAEAMDRIVQEILWALDRSDVLVIWAFDQSESMVPDQREIRDRIDAVYAQLGLHRKSSGDRLTTAVTAYGEGYLVLTKKPTSEIDKIREAIDLVPVDPSGKEMMCSAVASSIADHAEYAKKQKRQMMLILVTDETGEKPDNLANLEATVQIAKQAKCRTYILGREAVFGYPFAHMKWRHPITKHIHWLPVDRGPETAFVEQLQTECFRKRTDAHPSGFGPYGQTRLARETGGIYFMLPSLESDIVRGEKRRYELEAMRSYRPDLRRRDILIAERDNSILRSVLWKIIHDLNPYHPEVAKAMTVRFSFTSNVAGFVNQVRVEQEKARQYIVYLDAAAKALEGIRKAREQETQPRWQANYDLIYAQVLAYTARTYEYGAYLEGFITKPKVVPFEKPGMVRLSSWHIRESKSTVGGDLTKTYVDRATEMFNNVVTDHPGTPWAARAEWELARGYAVELREHYSYYGPRPPSPPRPTTIKIPIPKY